MPSAQQPDYGLDAPSALWITAGYGAVAAAAAGIVLQGVGPDGWWVGLIITSGITSLGYAALHLWSSKRGKQREAQALLDAIPWRGDEHVLDVGCGDARHRPTSGGRPVVRADTEEGHGN